MSIGKVDDNSSLLLTQDCGELRSLFLSLKGDRDVALLLEVSYNRLKYHTSKASEKTRYKEFSIPKKSGGVRKILAPCTAVKILQRKLSQILYSVYEPKQAVHGFVSSRSILTNAEKHVRKRFVLNIDLEDFFNTIHFGRVQGMFMKPPYNLPKEVAKVLAQICCCDGRLPQGAPTSPIVSNMICARMDSELRKLAKACKCTYTRYADDITFSTTLSKFPSGLANYTDGTDISNIILGERLKLTIQGNGFEVNEDKTRLQHKSGHQGVTGLTVNQFPNVRRSFIREISSMLYEWQKCIKLGTSIEERYEERQRKLLENSLQERPPFKENSSYKMPSFRQVLRGKIMFLGMIRGKQNSTYLTYLKWFNKLSQKY